MPINVTKNWLLGENANAGISGVGSGTPSLGSGSTFSGTATLSSSSTVPASIGGSLVLVSTSSGTDASEIKFENTFNDTSIYKYIIEADLLPTTDDRHIVAQFGYGGASTTWITSNYRTILIETNYNGSVSANPFKRAEASYAVYLTGTGGVSTDPGAQITLDIVNPHNTTKLKMWRYVASKWEQNNYLIHQTASSAWASGSNAFTAIKFFAYDYTGGGSHGNITGEIRMYGLKGS